MALVAERKEPLLHHQHYHHYLQGNLREKAAKTTDKSQDSEEPA